MKHNIFFSYNHQDKQFVRKLSHKLEGVGIRVWIDEGELFAGDSIIGKIENAIDEIEYLGVILSKHSVKSEWVLREIRMALTMEMHAKSVKVIPIIIDNCKIPGFLIDKYFIDFRSEIDIDVGVHTLIKSITREEGNSSSSIENKIYANVIIIAEISSWYFSDAAFSHPYFSFDLYCDEKFVGGVENEKKLEVIIPIGARVIELKYSYYDWEDDSYGAGGARWKFTGKSNKITIEVSEAEHTLKFSFIKDQRRWYEMIYKRRSRSLVLEEA